MQVVSRFKLIATSIIVGTAFLILNAPTISAEKQNNRPPAETQKTAPSTAPETQKTTVPTASKISAFCTELNARTSEITTKMNNLSEQLTQAQTQQTQKVQSQEQQVDRQVEINRAQADATRAENFAKLEAKATTDVQKQSVKTYEAAVESALKIRRDAFNLARSNFRTGVQNEIDTRRSLVLAQLHTFNNSVEAAIATAKASCADGTATLATNRLTFQASMKSAQDAFKGNRSGDAKVNTQVKALVTTRNAAFSAAEKAFQTSIASARQALMQAFGNSSAVK